MEDLSRYTAWLAKESRRLTVVSNDWEDLAQEGLIAMWKALETFDPEKGSQVTYLQRAARLRMADVVRRNTWTGTPSARGHTRERPATPVDVSWDWTHAPTADRLSAAEWAYHRSELLTAVSGLTGYGRRYVQRKLLDLPVGGSNGFLKPAERALLQERLGHLR
jgi:DNA-directed RNA polymerase specialized sigma24 family protein